MAARNTNREALRSFVELADQQYALVQDYANALTRLYNASSTTEGDATKPKKTTTASGYIASLDALRETRADSNSIDAALAELDNVRWDLRATFERLGILVATTDAAPRRRQNKNESDSFSEVCTEHLELSKRVVNTLYGNISFHENGVINDAGKRDEILATSTVAVAALNASVARMKTSLGME